MPGYCGGRWVQDIMPGEACPNGQPATYSPNGANEPEMASAIGEASSLTPTVQWNVNTSPVMVKRPAASYSGGIPAGEVETTIPYYEAQEIANELRGKANAPDATQADKDRYSSFVSNLRQYTGSELGTIGGVEAAWNTVLTDAYTSGVNAFDLLDRGPSLAGKETPGATTTSGGFGGGYAGPRVNITLANERDLRTTADTVASEVLGRGITDKEFNRILKKVRAAERTEPSMTTSGVSQTVSQQGLSAQGRQDIIREALMKGPEAEEFGKATKMMDLFYSALEARPSGA